MASSNSCGVDDGGFAGTDQSSFDEWFKVKPFPKGKVKRLIAVGAINI
jgi:hypothetical protein